jgi:hypothetical protein
VKNNSKGAVLNTRRVMPPVGQRATRAGQWAARRKAQEHKPPRGLRIFQQNFEFPWARQFQKAWSTPRTTINTTGSQNSMFGV